MANTTIALHISDAVANKLSHCYCGLSPQRKAVVDARVEKEKVSRQQATLDEILNPRIEIYYERGEENVRKSRAVFIADMLAAGKTQEQIDAFLNVPAK